MIGVRFPDFFDDGEGGAEASDPGMGVSWCMCGRVAPLGTMLIRGSL